MTHCEVFPRTTLSDAFPAMKSSKEGPSSKVCSNAVLEVEGVASVRAHSPTGSLLAARSDTGRSIELESIDVEAIEYVDHQMSEVAFAVVRLCKARSERQDGAESRPNV